MIDHDVELLAMWREQYDHERQASLEATKRAQAYKSMIDGLLFVRPELNSEAPPRTIEIPVVPRPSPPVFDAKPLSDTSVNVADVVREILKRNPQKWFTSGAMVKAVEAEGVNATHTAIRLALRRTGERGYSDKRGDGKGQSFRFHQEPVGADLFGGFNT